MDRRSEVVLLRKQLSELGTQKVELDAVIRRYIPKDGAALVPGFIDPVLERLKTMTAEELLPFVLPGTGSRKQITQSLREGRDLDLHGQQNLIHNVVHHNLLPEEVSARAVLVAEWTTKNEAEIATVRSRYKVIVDKLAEVERQIAEVETKYNSLTNLYEIKVGGTETQTRSRGVSGTLQIRALSVEEAIRMCNEDDIDWNDDGGYYEDRGGSEYTTDMEIDDESVKVIEDNIGSAKSAGA